MLTICATCCKVLKDGPPTYISHGICRYDELASYEEAGMLKWWEKVELFLRRVPARCAGWYAQMSQGAFFIEQREPSRFDRFCKWLMIFTVLYLAGHVVVLVVHLRAR